MLPHTRRSRYIPARRIPFHLRNTIVICCVHQLKISRETLLGTTPDPSTSTTNLGRSAPIMCLALIIKVPKFQVETLLTEYRSYDTEPPLRAPEDRIVVFLLVSADELEIAHAASSATFDFFGTEE